MPRPKKLVSYHADDATIRDYFTRSMALADEQKAASETISELNTEASDAGVHGGALSICRRMARLPDERRRHAVTLLARYLVLLLPDEMGEAPTEPAIGHNGPPSEEPQQEGASVPFEQRRSVA
jgi:hypothetical protein